jgi:hypothetical protein
MVSTNKDTFDPITDGRVMSKRGTGPVLCQSLYRMLVRKGLLGIAHDLWRNIAMEILMDRCVRESILMAIDSL